MRLKGTIFVKAEEICFECGAYLDVATSQDLDAPHENVDKNVYLYLATSQDLATIS